MIEEPFHVPGFRPPEYERAFDALWARACRGQVSLEEVRHEMQALLEQFRTDPPGLRPPLRGDPLQAHGHW